MRIRAERARVLITVKATPQPSEKYGDTSCVAGIRIDGDRPEWIRLYPIAFRWLDGQQQFHKYDIVELDVRRRDLDTRRESYSPTQDSWSVIETVRPWKHRHQIISQVEPATTCSLIRAAQLRSDAPSLGLIYPREIRDLQFEPHGDWTAEQIAKMRTRAEKEAHALIPMSGPTPALLKAPRFKVYYRYKCGDDTCPGHRNRILDWELTALQNRYRSDDDIHRAVTENFLHKKFAPDRQTGFFMGNFELAARRSKFSVLGVYSPRAAETKPPAPTLF
ncbi:hypothetical protein IT072_17350 [Leifsonia sp. ZF2019]|uniref:hypothetical protein n=1 Tax=Leifsonia sp. ZF2019 TaxID=2781978 RepID=UPI001CC038E8|nr:hypothetical protein [Leifsonia sp. ZF2019]UAJ78959.1 hypothetical protein IT072_17350 [Leifsonia sp. ZF2019]